MGGKDEAERKKGVVEGEPKAQSALAGVAACTQPSMRARLTRHSRGYESSIDSNYDGTGIAAVIAQVRICSPAHSQPENCWRHNARHLSTQDPNHISLIWRSRKAYTEAWELAL